MKTSWVIGIVAVVIGAGLGIAVSFVLIGHPAGASDKATAMANESAGSTQPASAPTPAHPQLWTCGMHPQVILPHPGTCPICHMKLTPLKSDDEDSNGSKEKKIAYWWDPMLGPSSIANHPGKSAMGMELVPVYEDQLQSGPGVRIDPTVVQNMGVVTAKATRGPLQTTIRAVGTLNPPEPGLYDVTLKISGYVQRLYADTDGMAISKGQVLFDLYSPDLQVAAQELISAEQGLKALSGPSADSARREAEQLVESAKRKLRLWDISEQDIDAIAAADQPPQTIPVRSPADGHIVDKMIVQGSAVQMGMKLMRIEDHHTLWLDAEVYEDQISAVSLGQEVRATVDGLPGKTFTGNVAFLYPHLNHMTRTETVRATLDNSGHELRPGMYATVNIITQPLPDALLIPREAVIDTGTRQIVFVVDRTSPGHFLPRNVQMGLVDDNGLVQIVDGIAPGEEVVTSGQFLMDVESRTTEAIQKLRTAGGAAATQPAMQ